MKTFRIIHIVAAVIGLVVVLRLADNLRPTFNENLAASVLAVVCCLSLIGQSITGRRNRTRGQGAGRRPAFPVRRRKPHKVKQ